MDPRRTSRSLLLSGHTAVVAFEISSNYLPPLTDSLEGRPCDAQEQTFCRWCPIPAPTFTLRSNIHPSVSVGLSAKLESRGYQPMTSLTEVPPDGARLIQLMVKPPSTLHPSGRFSYVRQEILGTFNLSPA